VDGFSKPEKIVLNFRGMLQMNIKKFGWICLGLTLLTNIIFYPFLPQKLGIHFDVSGSADRVVAKPLALLLMPAMLFLVNILYGNDNTKSSRVVLVGVIIFVGNIVINVVNLVMFK
jgi:uncharacterized membrane protein